MTRIAFAVLLTMTLSGVSACGGARARVRLDAERVARAHELSAQTRAADLWERAEKARRDAENAPEESDARADYTSEARLWLEAAIAEAARVKLAEERLAVEREVEAAEAEVSALERERAEVAQELDRRAAADIARTEAQRVLERARLAPPKRPKLSEAELKSAGAALIARAALIESALRAQAVDVTKLKRAIAEARQALEKNPELGIDKADLAHREALLALGVLRARAPAQADGEAKALAEAIALTGAQTARTERGLAARIQGAFAERSLKDDARKKLAQLCAVSRAHPHGPVRAVVFAPSRPVGNARVHQVTDELKRAGCQGERYGADFAGLAGDDLELTFLAY